MKVPVVLLGALLGLVAGGCLCRLGELFGRAEVPPSGYFIVLAVFTLTGACATLK